MSRDRPTDSHPNQQEPLEPLLQKFADELRLACRCPDKDGVPPHVMMQDRQIDALLAVASFVKACGIGRDVEELFGGLAQAISDLRFGTHSPLLAVSPHKGRSPDSSEVWMIRAHVVVGLDCLIERAEHPTKAAERAAADAAKDYPGLSALLRDSRDDLATSLLSWRNSFRSNAVNNGAAQSSYDDITQMLATAPSWLRKSMADELLFSAELRASALTKFTSEQKQSSAPE